MARTNADSGGATLLEESADFYRPPTPRESDARTPRPARAQAEPNDGAEEPFLRARRRVPVRRGLLPAWARSGWGKLLLAVSLVVAAGVALAVIIEVHIFLDHDPRFRIESSASIQTFGNSQLSRSDLLSVFGSDIGRNLFFVPLAKRRAELEQVPWVRNATVMRLLPNQLRVAIVERTPIAFVEVKGRVELADADGVILTLTPQQMAARHYSFPVVNGINPADPLSVRTARMQIYERFIADLDSSGEHISAHLSEVDLSDPNDVRATVPSSGTELLLHFGDEDFLPRWRNYQAHIAQWQQQYPHLASIDLRYEHEVVLKMAGDPGTGTAPAADTKPAPAPKSEAPEPEAPKSAAPRPAAPAPKVIHPSASVAPKTKTAKPHSAKHAPPKKHVSTGKTPSRRAA